MDESINTVENLRTKDVPRIVGVMRDGVHKLWQKELRETKFVKCRGQLSFSNRGRSAIGLLCQVYGRNVGGHFPPERNGGFRDNEGNYKKSGAPEDVLRWAGLTDRGPGIQLDVNPEFTVVALNDGIGCKAQSFEFIADAISVYL